MGKGGGAYPHRLVVDRDRGGDHHAEAGAVKVHRRPRHVGRVDAVSKVLSAGEWNKRRSRGWEIERAEIECAGVGGGGIKNGWKTNERETQKVGDQTV